MQMCNSGHSGLFSSNFENMLEPEEGQMVSFNIHACQMVQQKLFSCLNLCQRIYGDTLIQGQKLYKQLYIAFPNLANMSSTLAIGQA